MKTMWKNRTQLLACLALSGLAAGVKGQEQSTSTEPPPPPAAVQEKARSESVPFYSTLNQHGTWIQAEPFGMVWQPAVIRTTRDWKPYSTGGRWAWRDNAWCWQSDYEWGWVTFHYGRWMHGVDTGWIWVPGTEWAPAWVSWKRTSSVYRWAPLPVDKTLYVDARWNVGRNIEWGFSFSISDDTYCCAAATEFGVVETPQAVVVQTVEPSVTYVYRTEPVYYPSPVRCTTPYYYNDSYRYYYHDRDRYDRDDHHYSRQEEHRKPECREPERREPEHHTSVSTPKPRTSTQSSGSSRTTDRRTTGVANIMARSRK
jgi:hypothetical protein